MHAKGGSGSSRERRRSFARKKPHTVQRNLSATKVGADSSYSSHYKLGLTLDGIDGSATVL